MIITKHFKVFIALLLFGVNIFFFVLCSIERICLFETIETLLMDFVVPSSLASQEIARDLMEVIHIL